MTRLSRPPGRRSALLLSPHFDDAVFSCGGTAATLAAAGWDVLVATAFTRSVHPASGFALECQRDKGLDDAADYMALRRVEDEAACRSLGARAVLLDLPEAPNRGYNSAAALFAAPSPDDAVAEPLGILLAGLVAAERPDLLLAPQGCGRHVDHLQLIAALLRLSGPLPPLGFYRDTPYVIREAEAEPDHRVAALAASPVVVPLDQAARTAKQRAVGCYGTQLGFQFGSAVQAADAIERLMLREAEGHACSHAERLLLSDPAVLAGIAS